jgi:hypothetical protein
MRPKRKDDTKLAGVYRKNRWSVSGFYAMHLAIRVVL